VSRAPHRREELQLTCSEFQGLSVDEKKAKLLQIYRTSKEPYNLKEIEKLGSKAGVVQQTVKQINQDLVDDGKVQTAKIGISVLFWCFPCSAQLAVQGRVRELDDRLEKERAATQCAEEKVSELLVERPDTEERRHKIQLLQHERTQQQALKRKAEQLKDNDPAELARVQDLIEEAKRSANLHTDNIWASKVRVGKENIHVRYPRPSNYRSLSQAWLVKKRGISSKEADTLLGIKADFDYVS
jgi:hypothetical protein